MLIQKTPSFDVVPFYITVSTITRSTTSSSFRKRFRLTRYSFFSDTLSTDLCHKGGGRVILTSLAHVGHEVNVTCKDVGVLAEKKK